MCGIAGIFNYASSASQVERSELRAIRDQMALRGPDDFGEWFSPDGRLALGHRRLSIIDLSPQAHQPMESKDGRLVIAFNGEIYNYKILKRDLEQKGHVFRTHSDTEVLLCLYQEYGLKMFSYLRGMYAFALWDKDQDGLLLARDPLGIKPLYYANDGKTIRVASQVKALLESDHIDKGFDPTGQAGFLLWGYVPEPYTFYRSIRALPAGSYMWIKNEGMPRIEKFFDLTQMLAEAGQISLKLNPLETKDYLHQVLFESVKFHFTADVPVGIFLSAGFDSTVITALASELPGQKLNTITVGFEECRGTVFDETGMAELVAKQYGTQHKTIWISKNAFKAEYSAILSNMDQPSIDGLNNYFVSQAAAKIGLKVALTGLGGDEIFGTYKTFRYIPLVTKLSGFNQFVPQFGTIFRQVMSKKFKDIGKPRYAGIFEYGYSYDRAYFLGRSCFMPWELPEIMGLESARFGLEGLGVHFLELKEIADKISNDHLKIMALEMTQYMRGQLLRHADWAGMAHSLELRVPFVDTVLLKSLAPLFLNRVKPTKKDMAQSVRGPLPQELFNRPKTGFYTPLNQWLNEKGKMPSKRMGFRQWALDVYVHFMNNPN